MTDSSHLRVAFDATSLLGNRTGIGQITALTLEALAARGDLDLEAYAVTWRGRHDLDDAVPAGVRAATRRIPARLTRVLWPHVRFPGVETWTGPVDVVHATSFVAPPSRSPVVVTVHDLTFVRFPEMCTADVLTYPRLLQTALDRGATVHTYSGFVGDEVRGHFGLPHDRVVEVLPGLVPSIGGNAERGHALADASTYLLTLGTIEPRKNLPALVRAFDAIAGARPDLVLVIAGPDGWGVDAFDEACRAARHGDRVHRLGYVSDADRRDLLAGARLLAYPSIYEGFGLPPLEAMQVGIPVVAADAGALPQVLGDSALLPNPRDDDAIADALARVVDDDGLRSTLVERGHERLRRFSWDSASDGFAALYRRVAAGA